MGKNKLWRCAVCGYVHEGEAPPETCPVCGVPASEFDDITPAEPSAETAVQAWRCVVCGYLHNGEAPPDECPVCGAPASEFEVVESQAEPTAAAGTAASNRVVIAGGGIAGLSAAEGVREVSPDAEVIVLSAEDEFPYLRVNLTRYLAGEMPENKLLIHDRAWYEERKIDFRTGIELEKILPTHKQVTLSDGSTLDYGKLIVATGAHPFVPPVEGSDLPHVHTLRTRSDTTAILSAVDKGTNVVCIGGGILGLETAGALARHGAQVTVLEAFDYLMPHQLNATGSELLTEFLYTLGIDVITPAKTVKIDAKSVALDDGTSLPAELVVITVGVRANCAALAAAGLPVHHGVLVDNFMRTSNPDILAAGDVCEHDGVLYGSWAAAQFQGKIAGMNAAGRPTEFGGIPRSHTLKVLGKKMFSIGEIVSPDGSYTCIDEQDGKDYRMFMLHDGFLIGALLIGNIKLMAACRKAIEGHLQIGKVSTAAEVAEAIGKR
jgi:nitrite reductase (NADH) large subunit